MNDRITTLLMTLELSDRIYNGRLEKITQPIDYASVYFRLNNEAQEARQLFTSIFE